MPACSEPVLSLGRCSRVDRALRGRRAGRPTTGPCCGAGPSRSSTRRGAVARACPVRPTAGRVGMALYHALGHAVGGSPTRGRPDAAAGLSRARHGRWGGQRGLRLDGRHLDRLRRPHQPRGRAADAAERIHRPLRAGPVSVSIPQPIRAASTSSQTLTFPTIRHEATARFAQPRLAPTDFTPNPLPLTLVAVPRGNHLGQRNDADPELRAVRQPCLSA